MNADEKTWMADAISQCDAATRANLTVAFIRLQDSNNEADIVLTNAKSPEMLQAIAAVRRASAEKYTPDGDE